MELMKRKQQNAHITSYMKSHFVIVIMAGALIAVAIIVFSVFLAIRLSNAHTQVPAVSIAQQNEAFTKFNKIKIDMNYDDIVNIMGKPGELMVFSKSEVTPNSVPQTPGNTY